MKNPYKMILQNEGLPYKTLLGTSSTKTVKGEKLGFLTAILYLTPDDNICAMAKLAGCMEGCLYSSGRGAFNSVQNARQAKTDFGMPTKGHFYCHFVRTFGHCTDLQLSQIRSFWFVQMGQVTSLGRILRFWMIKPFSNCFPMSNSTIIQNIPLEIWLAKHQATMI